MEKERQESSRVRKALKRSHLGLAVCEWLASYGGNREVDFAEVRQGKGLAGCWDTSWDIIPFG